MKCEQITERSRPRRTNISLVFVAFLSVFLANWAAGQSQTLLEYPSVHAPVVGYDGMVVSQNTLATEVGVAILERGGNAVDAAVAMGFALAVTLPRAGNIGGGGFMTAYLASEKKTVVIDFRSTAPRTATRDAYLDSEGKESNVASVGYRAAAVPGTVAGLFLAHKKYGQLSWADLLEPAIKLAADGVWLTPDEAFVFGWGRTRLSASREAERVFFGPVGAGYQAGDLLRQPDLANTLRSIAKFGADGFYKGPVAQLIEADMHRHGGFITREDLAAYRAIEREPLRGTYRGYEIFVPPPPSGGAILLSMLNMLELQDVSSMSAGSAESLHVMAEIMRLGHRDRLAYLGDPGFTSVPVQGLISKDYAQKRAKRLPRRAAKNSSVKAGDPWPYESPSTTHFSAADRFGNLVSLTYTLGADFGSGVMIEGTGILLNNQMNNFSHERAHQAKRSGEPDPPNALQPSKRMISTMVPTLVLKDGKPWMAVGTPGGGRIINTVFQLIALNIDFKLNIDEATHMPRISQGAGRLEIEPNFNPDTVELLRKKGHEPRVSTTMGSAQSIVLSNGMYLGSADPRRPGASAIAPRRFALNSNTKVFTVADWGGAPIKLWYLRPPNAASNAPVVFVMHGVRRDADRYLYEWQDLAQEHGLIVAVPEFSSDYFKGARGYNFGNVFDENNQLNPRSIWAYSAIEPLFDALRAAESLSTKGYWLFGHSAGAQFVHRQVMLGGGPRMISAISANAGSYMVPSSQFRWPFGLDTTPIANPGQLFERPMLLLLGEADNDPEHPSLPRQAEALAQGPHRFARGINFFDIARKAASETAQPFAWRCRTVPGIAHDNAGMARAAVQVIMSGLPTKENDCPRL
jgi:gamma-glutamyltranspeptidase/glutathione hydrolase